MMRPRRTVPEGIRITKVGLWYVVLAVVVGVPAANTGNNALYMVVAVLLALLVVSGVTSRQNLRRLEVTLASPPEVYAGRPFTLRYVLGNRGRLMDRRLLVVAGIGEGRPELVRHLPAGGERAGRLDLVAERRGRYRVRYLHLSSIFPLGLFRKGLRYLVDLEFLVYPEILDSFPRGLETPGASGSRPSGRAGSGHELLSLRSFRPGDDRRGIHWKQSARTGELIYMEREAERERRVSILFDNAVGVPTGDGDRQRFERRVSEAATAVQDYLGRGYQVALVTRGESIPFGNGLAHRRRIFDCLALVEPKAEDRRPLSPTGTERAARATGTVTS